MPQQVQSLEAMLAALEQKKGAQVAVLMVADHPARSHRAVRHPGGRGVEARSRQGAGRAGERQPERAGGGRRRAAADRQAGPAAAHRGRLRPGGRDTRRHRQAHHRRVDQPPLPAARTTSAASRPGLQDLQARIEGEDLPPPWQREGRADRTKAASGSCRCCCSPSSPAPSCPRSSAASLAPVPAGSAPASSASAQSARCRSRSAPAS